MANVVVNDNVLLDMLMERVEYWTDDAFVQCLFRRMYKNYIEDGCFEGAELDIMQIVDNDYVNWCSVIEEGNEAYNGIKELYEKNGLGDISCEHDKNGGYSFIEAVEDGMFLVRS